MQQALFAFLVDDRGTILSAETAVIASVLILSITTIIIAYHYALDDEITEMRKVFTPQDSQRHP
jgi:hypothetical protein